MGTISLVNNLRNQSFILWKCLSADTYMVQRCLYN